MRSRFRKPLVCIMAAMLFLTACGRTEEDNDAVSVKQVDETEREEAVSTEASWGVLNPCFLDDYYIEGTHDKKLGEVETDEFVYTVFQHRNGSKYAAVRTANQEFQEPGPGQSVADISKEIDYEGEAVPVIYLERLFWKIDSCEVPEFIWQLGRDAFRGPDLTSLELPEGLTVIEHEVLCEEYKLETLSIPSSVQVIKLGAFKSCRGLKSVEFAADCKVESFEDGLFSDCRVLTDINIPENVKVIKYDVFSGCLELKEITIPKSVKEIQPEVFMGCTSLEKVIFEDPEGWTVSIKKNGEKDFSDPEPVDLSDPKKNAELLFSEDNDSDDLWLKK